jgi:hypothetical protein
VIPVATINAFHVTRGPVGRSLLGTLGAQGLGWGALVRQERVRVARHLDRRGVGLTDRTGGSVIRGARVGGVLAIDADRGVVLCLTIRNGQLFFVQSTRAIF